MLLVVKGGKKIIVRTWQQTGEEKSILALRGKKRKRERERDSWLARSVFYVLLLYVGMSKPKQ